MANYSLKLSNKNAAKPLQLETLLGLLLTASAYISVYTSRPCTRLTV